jgi:hypothetical protein
VRVPYYRSLPCSIRRNRNSRYLSALMTLANMSVCAAVRTAIVRAGAVPLLSELLAAPSMDLREGASFLLQIVGATPPSPSGVFGS